MSKYPLQDLLRVRLFREDAAQAEVTSARRKVQAAQELIEQRQQELADYIKQREQQEKQLWDDIIDQDVQMRDLDDLKLKIQIIRDKQTSYEEAVEQAKRDLLAAEEALEQAQADYSLAAKERRKIDEHKDIWAQEEAQRCEAEAEKEMEDFRVRKAED